MTLMNYITRRTVSRDLLIGLALTITIVTLLVGAAYYAYSTKTLESELFQKCVNISDELENVLKYPMWDLNNELIRQIIQAYMKSGYLIGATVTMDKQLIISKPFIETDQRLHFSRSISISGVSAGQIELYYSDKSIRDAQRRMINTMFVVIAAVIGALFISTYFVTRMLLNKPLSYLIQGIRNIGGGNYHQPLSQTPQHDINEIINEVNLMAAVIAKREAELKWLNQDLELRIAAQAEVEKALAESEKKYREIFENAVEGIFQTTLDGQIISANPTIASLLGYESPAEVMETVTDISQQLYVHPENRKELIRIIEAQNHVSGFECLFYRKNRETIWVSLQLRAVRDESGRLAGLEGFLEDITTRKKVEDELTHYRQQLEMLVKARTSELEQANLALEDSMQTLKKTQDHLVQSKKMAALGGLVAGVAHEINTPIGIGVTAASFLERKTRETDALVKSNQLKRSDLDKYVNIAVESTSSILSNLSRAAELIQSFKKLAVDQTVEEKVRFKLKHYLESVLLSLKPEFKRTKHAISMDCPDELELSSFPGAFMQIITNLVMNSLKHGFEKNEAGQITINVVKESEDIIIRYRDNGEGMNQQQIEHIYDPFYTTKRGHGGSGLGMHIVYNLVTRTLGGEIVCDSEIEKGTVFTIRVPQDKDKKI